MTTTLSAQGATRTAKARGASVRALAVGVYGQGLLILALVVIGVLGSFAYTSQLPRLYASKAIIQVYNPYRVNGTQFGQVDPTAIVALEVRYAMSSSIEASSQSQLSSLGVDYSRVAWSGIQSQDVLSLTCYAKIAGNSQSCAQTFAQNYVATRRAAVATPLNQQIASIRGQITQMNERVATLQSDIEGSSSTHAPTAARTGEIAQQTAYLARITTLSASALALSNESSTLTENYQIVSNPLLPTSIASPSVERDVALGGVAGLLLGIGLLLVWREFASTRRSARL